ncbi:unnamed protein product [Rhizoctonia solani]|uniref:Terpene synthase n=1 Tax=Rhizoctonia solani TaxID=456999 RepID=A0A8H3AML2_9AGAM|nr:unnamed protein product [Rhizoctonia solani]
MSGSTISLPRIPSYIAEAFQLPTELNPHQSEVEQASYAWFDSYEIYADEKRQRFFDCQFGLFAALCFPNAEAARFRITLDFTLWFFSFQMMVDGDAFNSPEEMKAATDAIMRAVSDPNAPSSNFQPAALIQSCFERIKQDGVPQTIQRFVAGLDEYTHACFQEKFNRSAIPALEECIERRRATSGMNLWTSVFQYTLGLDLPDKVLDHQSVSGLALAGTDLFNLTDDIYSSIRATRNAYPFNIVSVVMHHNNLDLNGSINFLDRLVRDRLDKYQNSRARVPSFGPGLDEQVAQYARSIEHAIKGLSEWAFMTPVYFGDQTESARDTGVVDLEKLAAV